MYPEASLVLKTEKYPGGILLLILVVEHYNIKKIMLDIFFCYIFRYTNYSAQIYINN